MEEATVFVVDDDAGARASIETLLRSVGLRAKVYAAAGDFLAEERPDGPCCLVLDVRLPGMSGLEFQRELAARDVRIPIIFITGHGDIPMSVEAIKGGAQEFLTKPFRGQVLLDAIQKALERDRVDRQDRARFGELRRRFETLTSREREVMERVIEGRLNKQIASELGTSERTIKIHRGNLMRKMGAESLPDLVRMSEKLALRESSVAKLP